MNKELIEQWELYQEFLNDLFDRGELGASYIDDYKNWNEFMVWLQTGRLSNGIK